MKLELDEYDVQKMCSTAIRDQLRYEFQSSTSVVNRQLRAGLEKSLLEMGPAIDAAVRSALLSVLASPEFHADLRAELLKTCKNKFGGTMAGIMKAAAKRVADDAALQQQIESAVVSAAPKSTP
jgi:hypothetical protein